MPRRSSPDPLAQAIGRRIQQLRVAAGLTREKLAHESATSSSGHLSDLERGLVVPNVHTLEAIAKTLGVLLADLVVSPKANERERLFEASRHVSTAVLKRHVRELEAEGLPAQPPKRR